MYLQNSYQARPKVFSLSLDGPYLVWNRKLGKIKNSLQLWGTTIFFSNESKLLKHPRQEQKQLNLRQRFTSTNPASSSKREKIALVGNQLPVFVNVAVRVKHSGIVPAFGILVNGFCINKDHGIFRNSVSTESCICDCNVRNCKRDHVSNSQGFNDGRLDERQT